MKRNAATHDPTLIVCINIETLSFLLWLLSVLGPNTTYVWASLDSSLNLVVGQTEWPYCQQGNTDDCHFKTYLFNE